MNHHLNNNCMPVRGIKFFKCFKCGEEKNNYENGVSICPECCKKLNICCICGGELEGK